MSATKQSDALIVVPRREWQTLEMITCGMSVNEMAATLGISPKTVEKYAERLRKRFCVNDMRRLSRIGMAAGLGPLTPEERALGARVRGADSTAMDSDADNE